VAANGCRVCSGAATGYAPNLLEGSEPPLPGGWKTFPGPLKLLKLTPSRG